MDPNQQLNQVKAQLAQLAQVQELMRNPSALAAMIQSQAPQVPAPQTVVQEPMVKAEHAQIIQFFESFVLKEPEVSKQLVSSMGSFYRHMQSMVAKSSDA